MKHKLLSSFLWIPLLASCNIMDEKMEESTPHLAGSSEVVVAEAASFFESGTLESPLVLTANRSWTASFQPEVSWARLSTLTSALNLGKVSRDYELLFFFDENESGDPRETNILFSIDGDQLIVPVRQEAFVPVLEVKGESIFADIPETGEEISIPIRSNTRWTAETDASSTASVSLSAKSGSRSGVLGIKVKPNVDISSPKTATVILRAEGCGDVAINISQNRAVPRFSIDREKTSDITFPIEYKHTIYLNTNVSWTAELGEGTSPGVTLSDLEGSFEENVLTVNFPVASLNSGHTAVVNFKTENGLSDSITLVQEPAILINFRKYSDNNGWTYNNNSVLNYDGASIPRGDTSGPPFGPGTYRMLDGTHNTFTLYSGEKDDAVIYQNHSGLVIGDSSAPAFYVEFPSFEGKKLTRIRVMLGNSVEKLKNVESGAPGTTLTVTDAEGNVVKGGEKTSKKSYTFTAEEKKTAVIESFMTDYLNHYEESMFDFKLEDAEPGKAYRIVGDIRMVMRWWILNYE